MKRLMGKMMAFAAGTTMVLGMSGCAESGSGTAAAEGSDKVEISIFNSKMEIQDQMLEMAKRYSEEKGVDVEVYYSSDTVAAHLSTRYASDEPYTISMVDAKDVYSLAGEHALDLSGEKWVSDTSSAISIDGKVYGFPVCVEARGIIYNADAIEAITGTAFDPDDYRTLTAFRGLLDTLTAGGMEHPTGIMKEDWSLGAHYLAEVYEQHEDPDAFLSSLNSGSASIAADAKFNSMMDTFDTLMAYNYAAGSAISAEREITEQKLAEGEIAFMFGGNWDWSVINAYDYSENMGIMPVPQDTTDDSNTKLVGGGSKYFFIDSSAKTTPEQQQAAKDFLNWLVYDVEGQSFLVEECALVPAYSNITLEVADPLGASVKAYADKGALIDNYNYLPDDHFAMLGASFQKYLAGQTDRDGFAAEIDSYWQGVTLTAH